jgi:hypothetical protein
MTTTDVNLAAAVEWGTYVPGGRIEIERFGWDPSSQAGWGPSLMPVQDCYSLVQRADESPHPMTWRSEVMSYEQAYSRKDELRIREAENRDDALSYVPNVTYVAFLEHHCSSGPCREHQTSLKDCPTKQCVRDAISLITNINEDRDRFEKLLKLVEETHGD